MSSLNFPLNPNKNPFAGYYNRNADAANNKNNAKGDAGQTDNNPRRDCLSLGDKKDDTAKLYGKSNPLRGIAEHAQKVRSMVSDRLGGVGVGLLNSVLDKVSDPSARKSLLDGIEDTASSLDPKKLGDVLLKLKDTLKHEGSEALPDTNRLFTHMKGVSSEARESFLDAFNKIAEASKEEEAKGVDDANGLPLINGAEPTRYGGLGGGPVTRVSMRMELFYSLSTTVQETYTENEEGRFYEMTASMVETVKNSFSLEMDFVDGYMQSTENLVEKAPELFNEFFDALNGLLKMDDESVAKFMEATDGLVGKLEANFGDAGGAFDRIGDAVKNGVSSFITQVRDLTELTPSTEEMQPFWNAEPETPDAYNAAAEIHKNHNKPESALALLRDSLQLDMSRTDTRSLTEIMMESMNFNAQEMNDILFPNGTDFYKKD